MSRSYLRVLNWKNCLLLNSVLLLLHTITLSFNFCFYDNSQYTNIGTPIGTTTTTTSFILLLLLLLQLWVLFYYFYHQYSYYYFHSYNYYYY